jgi:hypothetical protein
VTWPVLPPDLLVTKVDGRTVLVDRVSGAVRVANKVADEVLNRRDTWADVEEAAQWFAEATGTDVARVRLDLQRFEDDLSTPGPATGRGTYVLSPDTPGPAVVRDARGTARYCVDLLGVGIEVAISDSHLERVLRPLLAPFGTAEHISTRLDVWREDGAVILARDGRLLGRGHDLSLGVGKVLGLLTALALDETANRYLLHAAAVAGPGGAVVIGGASNQGKSSTVVELVSRGMAYLTDEVVRVDPGRRSVSGLARPIGLEGDVRALYPHLQPAWWPANAASRRWPVPPQQVGSTVPKAGLGAIVVLRYDAERGASVSRLSTIEALALLMPLVYHRERWTSDELEAMVPVLEEVPVHLVRHAGSREAADAIQALAEQHAGG